MKSLITCAAFLAAVVVADSNCVETAKQNWYCSEVNAISYTNLGYTNGTTAEYQRVSYMRGGNSKDDYICNNEPVSYTGAMSPLNDEVSMHFRGPLTLKQFAFYSPTAASNSRRSTSEKRHGHGHGHAHLHHAREPAPAVEERQLGVPVSANIDGVWETWANDWSGLPTGAPAPAAAAASAPASVAAAAASSAAPQQSSWGGSSSSSSSDESGLPSGAWTRQAYYNAENGTAEGLVFLNHMGGVAGSGTWDAALGNSLSFASADGTTGASSPQVLADTTLRSVDEIVIMSNQPCGANNGSCGHYRDGTTAYHGFGGTNKAFFFEFGMPSDGNTAASQYAPVDMPAIWLLNALIPRTLQYGPGACSCWDTGCGEFDIFEVLEPGDSRCKSTLHSNIKGGSSDYFARPFTGTIKAVLIMSGNDLHIKVLQDNPDFGLDIVENVLSTIVSDTLAAVAGVALFPLGA